MCVRVVFFFFGCCCELTGKYVRLFHDDDSEIGGVMVLFLGGLLFYPWRGWLVVG